MVVDAEKRSAELLALQDPHWLLLERDPGSPASGAFLRRLSLDELRSSERPQRRDEPRGPAPIIESEDRQLEGWGRVALDLTPGLTGLWQVLGRTSIPFEEMVKLDYLYVTNWSLWSDVRLILRTIPAVLHRSGAN